VLHYGAKANHNIVNKQTISLILFACMLGLYPAFAQEKEKEQKVEKVTALFRDQSILPIKLSYSNKEMKRNTNDSTYLLSHLYFQDEEKWDSIPVKIRARGNYRRAHCYFPPIKVKIKKDDAKGTIFKGNKELKVVLPCVQASNTQDNIVKEYMAYKIYEEISPYSFKTRMADIEFIELKGNKTKVHNIKGFFIEDIDRVAARQNARKMKRVVHPLEQDDEASAQNDFFQYMIGNTDYSTAYQHNQKLLFTTENTTVPLPYDFDMAGLVDASYAVVSQVQGEVLEIEDVTQRLYRGFERDEAVFQKVRKDYLEKKARIFEVVDGLESQFENAKEFQITRDFLEDFFKVLADDTKFNNEIIRKARSK
jgi:hypothetical protein